MASLGTYLSVLLATRPVALTGMAGTGETADAGRG